MGGTVLDDQHHWRHWRRVPPPRWLITAVLADTAAWRLIRRADCVSLPSRVPPPWSHGRLAGTAQVPAAYARRLLPARVPVRRCPRHALPG
ncbi:MAG TPA: hypothetical protein VKU39_19415 [Streptosporangiaceae bacterium]|nr:hypothetical protein [Streptosporangiaceae bacterium]